MRNFALHLSASRSLFRQGAAFNSELLKVQLTKHLLVNALCSEDIVRFTFFVKILSNLVLELHKNLRLFEIEVFLPNTLVFSKKPFHIFTWVCNLNYFPRLISLSSCYIVQFSKYNFKYWVCFPLLFSAMFQFAQICVHNKISFWTPRTSVRKFEKNFVRCVKLCEFGGDEENRTPDPLLARQVLSQLSYTPKSYTTLCYYLVSIRTTSGIALSLSRSLSRFLLRKNTVAHGSCNVSHFAKQNAIGGPKWTRTTDLTLIRRAL